MVSALSRLLKCPLRAFISSDNCKLPERIFLLFNKCMSPRQSKCKDTHSVLPVPLSQLLLDLRKKEKGGE